MVVEAEKPFLKYNDKKKHSQYFTYILALALSMMCSSVTCWQKPHPLVIAENSQTSSNKEEKRYCIETTSVFNAVLKLPVEIYHLGIVKGLDVIPS